MEQITDVFGTHTLYEIRWYWFKKVNSMQYLGNEMAYAIAMDQYRAAMGWS